MVKDRVYDIRLRTYEYAKLVIRFLEELPRDYVSQTLGKQLLRSATSIGANVMEAQASPSKKDFANFYNHSLKSANESRYWLGLLSDCGKAQADKAKSLIEEAQEIGNILGAILLKVRNKEKVK